MIQVEGVSKSFGRIKAVDKVSFQVKQGEIFGLVGPDGAGKTTLMRLICNLLTPDEGEIRVLGLGARERARQKGAAVHNFGYMPQRFSLYGDLTVMENLLFFGSMYKLSKEVIRQRSDEILELTNLIRFKNRFADNLSGGMKQKLALTCALVTRPSLLILDEPTYGVDPESRKEFWKILYTLNQEGMTILVSTPYMDEAELCKRVAFMNEGRFTTVDTPVSLKEKFPYEVLEIVSDSRNPDLFKNIREVLDSSLYGNKYRLILENSDRARKSVENRIREENLDVSYMQKAEPSMEDVFMILAGSGV